ncbi:MAG: metallophosphoesterase [Spirochaetales bacterium]|nr:metallophosphoesterase [Spirochaetales bacterium]
MKIGILSDTHDRLENISKAIAVFQEQQVEALIHAGDFCSPFVFRIFEKIKPWCSKMYAVFGNNDGDKLLLTQKAGSLCIFKEIVHEVALGGRKIAVMHYQELAERFYREGSFDLVVFGHTHKHLLEGDEKLLFNPGSCSGYLADRATVAVADLTSMRIELISL